MADIAHSLRIKYGLRRDPSLEEISRWRDRTVGFIDRGFGREDAGQRAAALVFPDYNTVKYASEADDIGWLLDQAGNKGQGMG